MDLSARREQEQHPLMQRMEIETSTTTTSLTQTETMAGPKISQSTYRGTVAAFISFTALAGYMAATQPAGAGWRFFSWHPFLMVTGFIGMMGSSAVTKKLGGYANTKLHGILASTGLMMALGGLYVIYRNKEIMGKEHITTTHSIAGIITIAGAIMASMNGGILLHPDWGLMKTNQTIRFAHKWFARSIMASAWITCVFGLLELTEDKLILAAFALPLVVLAPVTLI